jgi:hypothetical protein
VRVIRVVLGEAALGLDVEQVEPVVERFGAFGATQQIVQSCAADSPVVRGEASSEDDEDPRPETHVSGGNRSMMMAFRFHAREKRARCETLDVREWGERTAAAGSSAQTVRSRRRRPESGADVETMIGRFALDG